MRIDGQCHCGRITYEAEIDPDAISVCHCTDCQALTGSPFRVTAVCSGTDVHLTAGMPRIYGKRGDNGQMRFQHFCGDCGSPLFTSGEGDQAGDWGIRWGSIRQRDTLRPVRQIWCQSAVAWIDAVPGLPGRPQD
ncbi:GFA family protein [Bradyrhizobium sp. CSA207]|uniref:GFA family protein n=1 Tax=Bradyrhizobium sp. CSA207 TaxID=2698826 RepID=UPI0023AF4EB0|nr:GFA family protein [Bradyrhizobium sp. CSA207]MDE5445405.1 GFA family protein [Bradyrhizobium sp. CSA207]